MDFSKSSNKMPAIIDNAGNNRGACFDGKHVFVASRQNGNHIYYWTLGDSTGTPTELDLNGVTGGTFVLSDLAFTKDHLFLSNMVFVGGVFKVYAWKDRNSPPKILLEYPMAPARLGDAITVVGDPNTSAKLIASGHGTKNIYIWNIVNGTIPNTQPTIVPFDVVTNVNFARIQQVSDPATPSGRRCNRCHRRYLPTVSYTKAVLATCPMAMRALVPGYRMMHLEMYSA